MTPGDQRDPGHDALDPNGDDESPGVPGFRTWRGVYWFVLTSFFAAVLALTVFSRVFA